MARRRRKTQKEKLNFSSELTGLIFVLISIIGAGKFGFVGKFIYSFSVFLMGNWWAIFIACILVLGS